jgi:hypothetical protein
MQSCVAKGTTMTKYKALGLVLLLASNPASALSSADDLLASAKLFADASTIKATIEMSIARRDGTKARTLELFMSLPGDGSAKALARVKSPEFLRNMKMLKIRDTAGKSDTWIKTSQGVRRIAEGGADEPLFDSDFTADDLSGFDKGRFRARALEAADGLAWLSAVPTKGSDWAELRIGLELDTRLIARIDYISKDGSVGKRYRLLERQELGGSVSTRSCAMENLKKGSITTLSITGMELDTGIPDSVFAKGSL